MQRSCLETLRRTLKALKEVETEILVNISWGSEREELFLEKEENEP